MQRRGLVISTACAFACLGLLPAGAAPAHSTPPTIVTRLDPITPPLPAGVQVGITSSIAEEVYLSNPASGLLVSVVATTGEDFLRISREGVMANLASPDWWNSNNPAGAPSIPAFAKAGAAPRWVTVTQEPTWAWFDHRLHPTALTVPASLLSGNRDAVLSHWSIPIRLTPGASPHALAISTTRTITGTISYQPVRGGFLVGIDPPPTGVTAQVLQGRLPGLLLTAAPGRAVVVSGADGKDFARFSGSGVEVWTASRTWVADRQARGAAIPAGPARWEQVTTGNALTWLDPRLSPDPILAEKVRTARTTTTVQTWEVGLRVDGHSTRLSGPIQWVPTAAAQQRTKASPGPYVFLGVAALVGLGAFAVVMRLRKRARKIPAT